MIGSGIRGTRWSLVATVALLALSLGCGGMFGGETGPDDRPAESPFTWGLLLSWAALGIGGGSAVVGIWVDRDKTRPMTFAAMMSFLIVAAMAVGGMQGFLDEEGAIETRANLERMLDMVEEIGEASGDPNVKNLVKKHDKHRRAKAKRKEERRAAEPAPAEPAPAEPAPAEPAPGGAAPAEPAPGEAAPAPAPAEGGPDVVREGKGGKGKAKGGQ